MIGQGRDLSIKVNGGEELQSVMAVNQQAAEVDCVCGSFAGGSLLVIDGFQACHSTTSPAPMCGSSNLTIKYHFIMVLS